MSKDNKKEKETQGVENEIKTDSKKSQDVVADKEEDNKEELKDSEVIDLNEESKKKEPVKQSNVTSGARGKNVPKSTEDFIKKQKKRKRIKLFVVLGIIAVLLLAGFLWVRNIVEKTKSAFEELSANNVQTSFVEKKTLYDSKNATGTLYALESRTISRSLQGSGNGGAQIEAINVEVGDHVSVGDVLVQFSSENVEKSIAETKEDIGTQRKLDAISADDNEREYLYSYSKQATSMKDSSEKVERALKALYEACDAYGDAKRKRDDYKEKHKDDPGYEAELQALENAVSTAYAREESAQRDYDDAVEAQADNTMMDASNTLSSADSKYKQAQIKAGDAVKQYQRKLNDYIDSLDDYVVYATIDGVVTEVNVSEGNTFTSGNVLTIQDDSGFKAEVLIDEYDIPKVKKAYEEAKRDGRNLPVVVKTDATGDNEYKGHVTLIAPTSTSTASLGNSNSSNSSGSTGGSSSSVNYKVSIELDERDDAFMIGMSAKVAIVCEQSPDNSLCVPYNCVQKTEDGRFIVKVMDENGDKSTADDMMPKMNDANMGNADAAGTPDGIVIENNTTGEGAEEKPDKKKGFMSKRKNKEEVSFGRRYREVEVDKIFDTDYYAAVVPKNGGALNEGDEVMVVTEKSSGNDLMAMFGDPDGARR